MDLFKVYALCIKDKDTIEEDISKNITYNCTIFKTLEELNTEKKYKNINFYHILPIYGPEFYYKTQINLNIYPVIFHSDK